MKYTIDMLLCCLNELETMEELSGLSMHIYFTKTR